MADLLDASDVADLQNEIGPKSGDYGVVRMNVLRKARATSTSGGAGVDGTGRPVNHNAAVPTSNYEVNATYPCRLAHGSGDKEVMAGDQAANVNIYTAVFNWADNPDIRGDDQLQPQGTARIFNIIDPGGSAAFNVVRLVKCQEVTI